MMHMRTTLDLREDLVNKARELTGISEKTALVHAGLQSLIEQTSARRLRDLAGTMPRLKDIPRRRPALK